MQKILRTHSEAAVRSEDWGSLQWLASSEISASNLTLGRVVIQAGKSNPRHIHANVEEVLYLLKGRLKHWVGEEAVVLEPGDTVYIPKGVPHYAQSLGDEDADMMVAYDSGARQFKLA